MMITRGVFVFGSNRAGVHGAGAAAYARLYCGAEIGNGEGMMGKSYAIPTKDENFNVLSLEEIQKHVDTFIQYASDRRRKNNEFQVTQIGCGYAGYEPKDIAPMFVDAPRNCSFDEAWKEFLPNRRFWGTVG